jgi:ketosteroid isomerase-like protein
MTGHIEQIRHRYDQFSRGDIQGATQDWAGDFVWQGDGRPATTAFVHIWRWRGEQISRFQLVIGTLQLAQMLGLAADRKGTADAIDNP